MDQFENFKKIVADRKRENEQKYKDSSKKKLVDSVTRRMRTNMIGALDVFEKKFGELWGNGKTKLNEEELNCYNIWQDVRSKILDQGNNNIRMVTDEINQFECTWNRFHTEFKIDIK